LRVLHFSTGDVHGGAAKAAYRLHSALRAAGHSSRMLVRNKQTDDEDVQVLPRSLLVSQWRRLQGHLPWLRPQRSRFTFNHDLEQGVQLEKVLEMQPPDLILLHWVSQFLTARNIASIYRKF